MRRIQRLGGSRRLPSPAADGEIVVTPSKPQFAALRKGEMAFGTREENNLGRGNEPEKLVATKPAPSWYCPTCTPRSELHRDGNALIGVDPSNQKAGFDPDEQANNL
jgi:hypothetical protein